jgi:hypothetical protein
MVAILGAMLLGCGSVNDKHRTPSRMNPHDPMMTSRYLKDRSGSR